MKFAVDWSKTYYMSGTVVVEADSEAEAEEYVRDHIGDYSDGSTQYDPNEDYVEVSGEIE